MADNGRWFKVWTLDLDDPDFQEMTLEDIGRWVLLGALTKVSGDRGTLVINGTARRLCEVSGVRWITCRTSSMRCLTCHLGHVKHPANVLTVRAPLHGGIGGSIKRIDGRGPGQTFTV